MSTLERKRRYLLVFLAATLSSTVVLKFADIQYLELIFAADFLLLAALFVRDGLQVKVYRPFFEIGKSYAIFLGIALLLSFFALQQSFSHAFSDTLFKKPIIVTLARMAELLLDVFYMLYLASLYRDDERLCLFGAKTYYWVGVAGCIYSIATFPLNVLFDAQLGTYNDSHRMRGFDNEGGSFGLYLLSVCLVGVTLYRRGSLSRKQLRYGMASLVVGMIGSQSKSLLFASALLGVIFISWVFEGWKRFAVIAGMFAGLFFLSSVLDFRTQIDAYILGSSQYQKVSNLRSTDGNFVMGRVAGAVLAPRMIAARPILGVGWGNYPLVRDDREYRQGAAFALNSTDAPGLGLVDYIVELGIPLWLYLIWIELKPVFLLRQRGANIWLLSLALMQPLSNWAGSHLNLTHPWVVLSFALGIGFHNTGVSAPELATDAKGSPWQTMS